MGNILPNEPAKCAGCDAPIGLKGIVSNLCDKCANDEKLSVFKCKKCRMVCANGRECRCNQNPVLQKN